MKHLEIKVLGRKSLAITLAVAIAMTTISINNLSVRAESTMETLVQGQTSINEISEGKETILNTTQQFEEDNKVLINTIEETNKIEESNSLDSSTDLEESESLETVSNNGIECEVLETITLSATVDTIRIVAKAEQGVLPENAILQVEEIITTEVIESAVEDTITSMEKIQEIKSYDIKIMSDGIEVQPEEGTVHITFEGISVAADETATIIYTSDDASVVEKKDTQVGTDVVAFEAEHFSIYNVVITTIGSANTTIIPVLVPAEYYTQIDVSSILTKKIDKYRVETTSEHIKASLFEKEGKRLELSGNPNTKSTVTIIDKETESIILRFEARVSQTPNCTPNEFGSKVMNYLNAQVNNSNSLIKNFFDNKNQDRQIDSCAINTTQKPEIDKAIGGAPVGYSYVIYNKKDSNPNYSAYYTPVNIADITLDELKVLNAYGLQQYVSVMEYSMHGTFVTEKMIELVERKHPSGGSNYIGLNPNSLSETTVDKTTYTLIYEVHPDYQNTYTLNKGGTTYSTVQSGRITAFGVWLKDGGLDSGDRRCVMSLKTEATGKKDNKEVNFPAGSIISTLDKDGNAKPFDSPSPEFGFTEFDGDSTVHIYVSPAAYQVTFENRNGNVISSKEYLLNTNITDVPTGLLADGSKAISWSIKGDDSGLEYSAETIKNLKVNANITFVPTQVEVPVTFYRKIANNQYEKYGVGFLEESVLRETNKIVSEKHDEIASYIKAVPDAVKTIMEKEEKKGTYIKLCKEGDGWHVDFTAESLELDANLYVLKQEKEMQIAEHNQSNFDKVGTATFSDEIYSVLETVSSKKQLTELEDGKFVVYKTDVEQYMKEINITNLTLTDGSVIDWYRIVKESDGWHIDGHRINQFLVTFLLNNNTENILVDVKEKEPFDITKIPVPTKASTSTTAYRFLGYRIQGTTNVLSQEDLISYLNSLEQNIVLEAVYSETAIITQGGGTTAPTPITTTPVEVPSISEVVTTTQGTAITMPMQNNQQTESLTGENTTVIEDDEVARAESLSQGNAEEKDLTTIEDEGTALAAGIDSDCYIHWLILLIGIAYSVFAIVRIYLRKKEIDELEDDATSLETEA